MICAKLTVMYHVANEKNKNSKCHSKKEKNNYVH